MGWYDHMGEVDPYQSQCIEELRRSRLRPHAARAVLWSAGGRILGDPHFSLLQRNQASIYLKTILKAVYSLERQDIAFADDGRSEVRTSLDMGYMMGWAFLEIHNATFGSEFDPSNRTHQAAAIRMQLTVGYIESHLEDAYRQFRAYEAAQQYDPTQTDVKWY